MGSMPVLKKIDYALIEYFFNPYFELSDYNEEGTRNLTLNSIS